MRRVLRARLTHFLGIAVCAFALSAVVVGGLASPAPRPPAFHTFRGPIEVLPAILQGPVPGPVCSYSSQQPLHNRPPCP
jgi:hypothetical protein